MRDIVDLLLLSVLWGAAYLFMRAAVPSFGAAPLAAVRLGLAALLLLPLLAWRGGLGALRLNIRHWLVIGLPGTALPFLLLTQASLHITAGLVAVLNATAPLFSALFSHLAGRERLTSWRWAGLAVGIVGVALLTAGNVSFKSVAGPLAVAAVLLCSVIWGLNANYARQHLPTMDALTMTVGSLSVAALGLAPFAIATWPAEPPGLRAWAEVVFLGIGSSGLGMLMYFRLLRRIGAVRALAVTFLNPVVATVAAAGYLGENITVQMVVGGGVVLLGTALSLGLIGPRPAPVARPTGDGVTQRTAPHDDGTDTAGRR
ncbi:MAG: DMT family transporter [Aquabacterium sp.]